MADTGYARTTAFPTPYRTGQPDQRATTSEWETLGIWQLTTPTDQPWHVAAYCTADVEPGVVGQLRLRSSAAVTTSAPATGLWSVVDGRIIQPDGTEAATAGLNGGVGIGTGAAFTIPPATYIAWAYDRYPGNFKLYSDVWPGDTNVLNGAEVFPGGTISSGSYWSSAPIDAVSPDPQVGAPNIVTLPDRCYAMNGQRSAAAIAHGIAQPTDHWHCGIFRVNAHLRNGPPPERFGPITWNGAPTLTAADTAPQYVARVQELVDQGLIACPEFHDRTAVVGQPDFTVPAGLLANPMLSVASLSDDYVKDACVFYDALCAAFSASDAVWIGLPNEFCQTGRTTAYDDVIVTLVRRIRGNGFQGIITLPLPRWAGDLAALARGDLETLVDRLATHSVSHNLVWEWHNYGDRYSAAGVQSIGTWAEVDSDIAACRNGVPGTGRRHAVWMSEYGQPLPIGSGLPHAADGVRLTATDEDGPALGGKWPHLCPTWWSTADNSFDVSYALTYGAANKGNEAGPDPNSTGANPGTYPWWDVTTPELADEWLTAGGRAHWDLAKAIAGSGDAGALGISPAVSVTAHTRNVRLGFEAIPNGAQLLYVEGRRIVGTGGGVRLKGRPALTAISAPPVELRTSTAPTGGTGGGSGGGTVTVSDVRSTYVSATEAATHTILPSSFSPAAQPGDKVVLIGAGPGPSDVSSWSWTFPGTVLTSAGGGTYNPRVIATVVDYNAAGWTVAASSSFRAAAICLTGAVGLAASTPVQAFSPANPASVAHAANAVGLVVNVLNFTTASVTAATTSPGTHTTVLATPLVPRQIHVAKIARTTAGTYDPGAATTGPGSEESTAFAIVAQPTASSTFPSAPTIPTFNTGTAITLGTLSADIAAAVAAQPPGTHFKLISGTYTNWSNVRPKTDMHFQSPNSGTATLEGTGKTWAFRAIDATGSSDNVTISCTGTGSIKIQNYGAGTTRAEYGAIQAQPTDTSVGSTEFTYGTAQGWFIQGVELSKNGAQGIRVSDYFTLYQVTAYGHTVSNVGGDRGVGGLIHSCTLDAGGLNPATGVASNGAGAKFTFWNASEGRSQVVPSASLRPKAPIRVVSTNMAATHAGVTGTGNIGLWFDLDCQQIEIYGGNYTNHPWCGIVVEGCNNVYMTGIAIDNSDGYGATNGEDFILGALTIAESTNVTVENYGILNSDRALIIRQSNRSADWYNSNNAGFVNYAWPATSGGVRYWIDATGPLPVPGVSDRANMWSGNITIRNGLYTLCSKVILSEGTNGGGMSTAGSLPLSTIHFLGNDYLTNSPSILFYDRSTTGISFATWRAQPYDRDQ